MRHPAIDEASHPELLEMFHQMLGLACRAASRVTGHFIGWPWLAGRSAATGVRWWLRHRFLIQSAPNANYAKNYEAVVA